MRIFYLHLHVAEPEYPMQSRDENWRMPHTEIVGKTSDERLALRQCAEGRHTIKSHLQQEQALVYRT